MTDRSLPSSHVDLVCTACGEKFRETLALLKTINVVQCPKCARPISVRRYKAQAGASALFKKLTGFAGGTKGS